MLDNMVSWKYRGQITQGQGQLTIEVHIRDIIRQKHTLSLLADATLWCAGIAIYQVEQIGIQLSESDLV